MWVTALMPIFQSLAGNQAQQDAANQQAVQDAKNQEIKSNEIGLIIGIIMVVIVVILILKK